MKTLQEYITKPVAESIIGKRGSGSKYRYYLIFPCGRDYNDLMNRRAGVRFMDSHDVWWVILNQDQLVSLCRDGFPKELSTSIFRISGSFSPEQVKADIMDIDWARTKSIMDVANIPYISYIDIDFSNGKELENLLRL